MALPESGISIPMVARELGTTENDLGRLCTHENINKWSKYKPVLFESVNRLSDSDRASVDWGFRAYSYPTYQQAASSGWSYRKPTGGATSPYRLMDFEKYNKDAQPFVTDVPSDITISYQNSHLFEITIDLNTSDFELIDFSGEIGSFYYGIVFVKGGVEYIQTAKFAFGLGEGSILVETTHPFFTLGGTIEANHILINQKIENFTLLSNIVNDAPTFISLPVADGVSNISTITAIPRTSNIVITKVGENVEFLTDVDPYSTVGGLRYLSARSVFVKIDVQNDSNALINIENMSISATPTYFDSDGYTFIANMFNASGSPITTLSVPANSSGSLIVGVSDILNTDSGIVVSLVPEKLSIFSNIKVYNKGVLFTSRHIGFQSSLDL